MRRRLFRAMSVIHNEAECHGCHDPRASVNGILLMDLEVDSADRRVLAGMGSMLGLGSVMVLLTVAVLVLLLRRMVHTPLEAVVNVSRRVAQGDLDARISICSSGEFNVLADSVNRMTDHLGRSLQTVDAHRRELQSILDSVDDEIVVLDRDQRVVAVNEAFVSKSGSPASELTGRTCREVSAPRWPCAADQPGGCPVERVFRTDQLHKGLISRTGPDGEEIALEIHASAVRGVNGVIHYAVEVRRDISE
jgi:PAS domain S-box-containing protein